MKHCKNPKCRDTMHAMSAHLLCPACRFLARWMFGLGAALVGALFGALKFFGAL